MSYSRPLAIASRRYLPNRIRLLFIAEAPPALQSGRFFYFPDVSTGDTLFLEMMKVLYPDSTGFDCQSGFAPGRMARQIRERKPALLARFQKDGFYLIDASSQPMPPGATMPIKLAQAREELPALRRQVRILLRQTSTPIVLIGAISYTVCAAALREDGCNVLNSGILNHPSRGGQRQFRRKLVSLLDAAGRRTGK